MVFVKGQPNPGFKPGQSGNPGGKSKATAEFRSRCQQWMLEDGGWEILVGIAQGKGRGEDQFQAVRFIAEQAHGKAVQQIAGADDAEFDRLRIVIERGDEKPQLPPVPYVDPRVTPEDDDGEDDGEE